MISVYDLYDLHAILVNIRSSPSNEINKEVILKVINVLKNRDCSNDMNQFRIALQPIYALSQDVLYAFTSVENKYCYFPLPFLKDEKIYTVLVSACEHLLTAICAKNEEKIYDLADCLHNLPIFIVENSYSIPKKYWKNEVKYYRKKWDKDFLIDAE